MSDNETIVSDPTDIGANRTSAIGRASGWLANAAEARPSDSGLDPVEAGLLAAAVAIGGVAWLALVLGSVGLFSVGLLAASIAVVAVAALIFRRRLRLDQFRYNRWLLPADMVVLILALAAGFLWLRPFEFTVGAQDPGVYVLTGANIARTGSITIVDRLITDLPPDILSGLFEPGKSTNPFYDGARLAGFYITDASSGRVSPHAFHLYPSLLAVGYAIGGIPAELLVTPLLAILALCLFYALARRTIGSGAGAIAAVLLVTNLAQNWFARFPDAEILVQVVLFGGLLALVAYLDTSRTAFAAVSGALLGLVHLAKIEIVFLPMVLGAFLVYEWFSGHWKRGHTVLTVSYTVVSIHALAHAWILSPSYTYAQFEAGFGFLSRGKWLVAALVAGTLLVIIGVGLRRSPRAARIGRQLLSGLTLTSVIALVIVALAAYAYYIRPMGTVPSVPTEALPRGTASAIQNAQSLVRLGWYVPPLELLLGIVGVVVYLVKSAGRRGVVLLSLLLIDTIWNLYETRVVPIHFWTARRWLVTAIPLIIFFASYVLTWLAHRLRWRWPDILVPAALGLVLIPSNAIANVPFLSHVEFAGATAQVQSLADRIPPDALVVFDDDPFGLRVSAPMEYLFDRQSVLDWKYAGIESRMLDAVRFWRAEGRTIYWVRCRDTLFAPAEKTPPAAADISWQQVGEGLLDVPEAVVTWDHRPDSTGKFTAPYGIFLLK